MTLIERHSISVLAWLCENKNCFNNIKSAPSGLNQYVTTEIPLRILTGKNHPKIKLQRLRKRQIWTFESLVHQINSF